MTLSSFETDLYRLLTDFFDRHQYRLLLDKKQFRKTTGTGFQNVIFTPTIYSEETWLEVNFGCRNNQTEQIAQQFLNNAPGFRDDANTLIVSLGNYNEVKHFRYKVQTSDDLSIACEQIEEFFINRGFEFMDEAGYLRTIDHLLNQHPMQFCKYMYNQSHRCFKGMITARLTNHPAFSGLADTYRRFLKHNRANPVELLNFERLVDYLIYYSPN